MKLVYLGSPEAAVPPLRALVAAGHEITLVVSQPDRKRGRGGALLPSPVKAAALELGLPVSDRPDDVLAAVDAGAELGVVVAYGRLIKPHLLERLTFLNLHFSLLPRWRGAAPVERAVLAGDAETGVCLMQLEEGLDTGPVYRRVTTPIGPEESATELRDRLVEVGTTMLVDSLAAGVEGLGTPVVQEGEPTYAAKIDPAELEIHWSQPAEAIARLVRMGGAWTTFRDKRLKVLAARPASCTASQTGPGTVHAPSTVQTGDGGLELLRVQPEGKGAMDAAAWRNGAKPAGEVLGA